MKNKYLKSCAALVLCQSVLGLPLNSLALAQDDVDRAAGAGVISDLASDSMGVLVMASVIHDSPQDRIVVQRSSDRGQSWIPLYEGKLGNLTDIHHLSLDLAYGYADPSIDRKVFIAIAATWPGSPGGPGLAFHGLLSGSIDQPWSKANCEPLDGCLMQAPAFEPMHTSVAVLPFGGGSDYAVGVARTYPPFLWNGLAMDLDSRMIRLSFVMNNGLPVGAETTLAGPQGQLEEWYQEHLGAGHPSLIADRQNETMIVAFHSRDYGPGPGSKMITVGSVDIAAHLQKGVSFKTRYSTGVQPGQTTSHHHPVLSCDKGLVAFTCLTGLPDPQDHSYRLTAYWGSVFTGSIKDSFIEVSDFLWMGRGFHAKTLSPADLILRGDTMHFSANCIVDTGTPTGGLGILQFRSDMIFPSESAVWQVNDYGVGPLAVPKVAVTPRSAAPEFEAVAYPSLVTGGVWVDQ